MVQRRAREAGAPAACTGTRLARQHSAEDASRGRTLPMIGTRLCLADPHPDRSWPDGALGR